MLKSNPLQKSHSSQLVVDISPFDSGQKTLPDSIDKEENFLDFAVTISLAHLESCFFCFFFFFIN